MTMMSGVAPRYRSETKMITDDEIAEIEFRANHATPGPWEAYSAPCCPDMGGVDGPKDRIMTACVGHYGHPALLTDAEFMAHARTDIPHLIAELQEARARVEEMQSSLVAEHVLQQVIILEREACAKICDKYAAYYADVLVVDGSSRERAKAASECAKRIRERGEK